MMKHALALLLLASTLAHGSTDSMVAECERQMVLGSCRVQLDNRVFPANATVLIGGVGRVPRSAYVEMRGADKQMCSLARRYCTEAPDGAQCAVARAFWGR